MKPSKSGYAGWRGRGAAVSALALALAAAWPPPAIALAQSPASAEAASGPALTLEGALRRAVAADPARPGLDARLRGVEAGVRQAGLRPNPTLGLMVENLPTLGGGDILGRTETTLTYEQKLERGGDRSARTGLAQSEGLLITAQAQIAQL
ncbi:MAG: TolC family protein, partial [Pseudomonadota bacterium]|nr:TolC family protein [Pseudomonadota bacterium]